MTDLLYCLYSLRREFSKINVLRDFFFHGCVALMGLGLLIVEVSRSHAVGLSWKSDWNVAQTST